MTDMVIIDFQTLQDDFARKQAKTFLIEFMVRHPEAMISVVNAAEHETPDFMKQSLRGWQFPFDTVSPNPLDGKDPLTFKTMFAATVQKNAEEFNHSVVLVMDSEAEARSMWLGSGAEFAYDPTNSRVS
jgi:hypothetical protein